MDPIFCCLLGVGVWLEVFCEVDVDAQYLPFVFSFTGDLPEEDDKFHDKYAKKVQAKVYTILHPILANANVDLGQLLVAHSVQKYAATWSRSNGISKDDKDHRGRWKNKQISDIFNDVQLDWPDAKVASVLCPGGVCSYVCIDNAVTPEWIATNVTPNITATFGQQVAVLLGCSLLWLAHSENRAYLPEHMVNCIRTSYAAIKTITGDNPIEKRLLAVSGNDGEVHMEEV